ncbi:hypothetical protein VTJ04DRAFT_10584 [Mycothermus thermophilus]|uniref:uncharacterized protein n=1 Tax=Humicola insolens TaxID=85995 RepID=UPI003741F432
MLTNVVTLRARAGLPIMKLSDGRDNREVLSLSVDEIRAAACQVLIQTTRDFPKILDKNYPNYPKLDQRTMMLQVLQGLKKTEQGPGEAPAGGGGAGAHRRRWKPLQVVGGEKKKKTKTKKKKKKKKKKKRKRKRKRKSK